MKPPVDSEIHQAAEYWVDRTQGPWTEAELVAFAEENVDVFGPAPADPWRMAAAIVRERWLWHWADSGFTTFRSSHSYAAALMATDPNKQAGDLLIPWTAVRVQVPDGLLQTDNVNVRCIYVLANTQLNFDENRPDHPDCCACVAYSDRALVSQHREELIDSGAIYRVRAGRTLADVLWDRSARELDWLTETPYAEDEKQRLMLLACNYVAGLFYTLQHTGDWSAKDHANRWQKVPGRLRRPPPTHRNVVVGRPIGVNLKQIVQAMARGDARHTMPSMFQALVRGHYKRQVIGVGRSGRKVIWVEPYWRGPEAAPMLVRPYVFEGG